MLESKATLTFYALATPRGTKVPIDQMDHLPSDWIELKTSLAEAMKRLYIERRQTKAIVLLERHMSGKFTMRFAPGTYVERKVRYMRQPSRVSRVGVDEGASMAPPTFPRP